jgi:hypothetical protein
MALQGGSTSSASRVSPFELFDLAKYSPDLPRTTLCIVFYPVVLPLLIIAACAVACLVMFLVARRAQPTYTASAGAIYDPPVPATPA